MVFYYSMKVKDILLPGLKTISIDATMAEAEKILKEANIRHLPVSNGKAIVGMITAKDVSRASTMTIDEKRTSHIQNFKLVSDYMSSPVLRKNINDDLEELVKDMIRSKISCFVIDDETGKSIGIVTTEDLLLLLVEKLQSSPVQHWMTKLFGRS